MKPDLVALVIGLLACIVGALAFLSGFVPLDWGALRMVAPFFLIGIGVVALVLAVRHR